MEIVYIENNSFVVIINHKTRNTFLIIKRSSKAHKNIQNTGKAVAFYKGQNDQMSNIKNDERTKNSEK